MKRRSQFLFVAVFFAPLICGCGIYALPQPTNKQVNVSDVVGTWQYKTDFDEATITLLLNKNGSFLQKIPASSLGKAEIYKGNWTLDGSYVSLDKAVFINFDRKRTISSYGIWVIDDSGSRKTFTLFGGDGFQADPDSGEHFEKVS